MSKHPVEPQVLAPVVPVEIKPPAPKKVPIGQCEGLTVSCPRCGYPTHVTNSRGNRAVNDVPTSVEWMMSKCTGPHCGSQLESIQTMVTVVADRIPVIKQLAAVIGKGVHCPYVTGGPDGTSTVCWLRGLAEWSSEEGHGIRCYQNHAFIAYPADMMVELWED